MQPISAVAAIFSILLGASAFSAEIFKVRLSSTPKTFDWTIATSGSESAVIQNIMRGIPDLTRSSQWDSTSKILTLTLKSSATWSDGKPLRCRHFYDSFERLLNPGINSPNASLLFDLESAREYFLGKEKKFSAVGVRCENDDRLVLRLKEPRSNFLNILSHWSTFPFRKDKPNATIGDYQWVDRPSLQVKKSSPASGGPERVQFVVVPDGSRALLDYESGKLQYLLQVEDDLLNAGVLKTPGIGFVHPLRVVALLQLNPSHSTTQSPDTRRAILSRIPIDTLVALSPNARVKAPSIIPTGIAGGPLADSEKEPQFRNSLGEPPLEVLTLGYPNDSLSKSIAQTIQDKTTGLKIKIEPLPSRADYQRYHLVLSLFGLDYLDADQLLASFLSQGTLDLFDFSSADFLRLVQQARATQNNQERAKIYSQAARFLQDRAAIVLPLFYRRRAYLLNPQFAAESGTEGTAILSRLKKVKR